MTNTKKLQKIIISIHNGRLRIKGGIRNWFNYSLNIEEMVWGRNLRDGANVHVFENDRHIGTINVDYNLNNISIDSVYN